jgi:hypothetical protein
VFCDREQRRGSGMSPAGPFWPDKYSDGQLYMCSYAQLLVLMDASARGTAVLAPDPVHHGEG